jgi:hypothetical protein
MTKRRFPPPWTIEEANDACLIVRDKTGRALGYFHFENEPGRLGGLFVRNTLRIFIFAVVRCATPTSRWMVFRSTKWPTVPGCSSRSR